jgi:hypothetical protein
MLFLCDKIQDALYTRGRIPTLSHISRCWEKGFANPLINALRDVNIAIGG